MKLLRLSTLFILLIGTVSLGAKTLTANDQIVFWTPQMIRHLESVRPIVAGSELEQEVDGLITQWQSFQNNLAPRKSNQKLFLRLSKQNEELFNKISSDRIDKQRLFNELHHAQNNVRGKK